ncbi:twin-arginine translocation signal domain-containing protein [Parapedobacter koreensis]
MSKLHRRDFIKLSATAGLAASILSMIMPKAVFTCCYGMTHPFL